jgi:hypothetical protein
MKRVSIPLVVLILALTMAPGVAQEDSKEEYKSVEAADIVTIKDKKGVETTATGFGKLFGPDYLNAIRGDSTVQIPFTRIKKLETGKTVDHRMSVTLHLVSGRKLEVLVDRPEYSIIYGGTADFGYFRLHLQDVREIVWTRVKRREAALGQKCVKGHIFYNDTWHYCPYDGEKLKPIKTDE